MTAPRRRRAASDPPAPPAADAEPAPSDDLLARTLAGPPAEPPAAGAPAADPPPDADPPRPHYHGHRDRLRQRFLAAGPEALHDHELLELLLFQAIPRRDVKPLAKSLLARFGTLWAVVNAPPAELKRFGLSDASAVALAVVGATALRMARQQLIARPVLSTWDALVDYCQGALAHERVEQVRVLFLDKRNQLIADEAQQRGTVDHTPIYPREVVKRALDLGASALILVHNHPSGDPTPSRDDIEMTRRLAAALAAVGIEVFDHLVIGRGRHTSFKALGLM